MPSLEQTLERYLATVKPIVNEVQYERTRAMLKAFGSSNGPGARLQEKLLQLREGKDNWVSTWKQYDVENVTKILDVAGKTFNFKSDVWLTVHRNSVWIRKTN